MPARTAIRTSTDRTTRRRPTWDDEKGALTMKSIAWLLLIFTATVSAQTEPPATVPPTTPEATEPAAETPAVTPPAPGSVFGNFFDLGVGLVSFDPRSSKFVEYRDVP